MKNPCNTPLLSKAFKTPKQVARRILGREIVEELIYNTQTLRDRLTIMFLKSMPLILFST
jgi:hypothetical protein